MEMTVLRVIVSVAVRVRYIVLTVIKSLRMRRKLPQKLNR